MRINIINSATPRRNSAAFAGMVGGENFADDVIKEAKRLVQEKGTVNVENYKKNMLTCMGEVKFQPLEWLLLPYAKIIEYFNDGAEASLSDIRVGTGVATLGLSEVLKAPEAGIRKLISNIKAQRFADSVKRCMVALAREHH